MRRGDLVTIALQGDYGKPRPALVIQSNFFDAHPSLTVLPVTSELRETPLFRVTIEPTDTNALRNTSQVMVNKCMTVAREKIGDVFGRIEGSHMLEVERTLAVFLGIAK